MKNILILGATSAIANACARRWAGPDARFFLVGRSPEKLQHVAADLANRMEAQGQGAIAVISSVAGDWGRPSNYLYGAAKSGVTAFCSGLRGRLFKAGVHVLTIKPGFVDTPMTAGLPLPKMLVATPEQVAVDIVRALEKRQDTLYTRWFWRYIMLIIIHIPGILFKRLGL